MAERAHGVLLRGIQLQDCRIVHEDMNVVVGDCRHPRSLLRFFGDHVRHGFCCGVAICAVRGPVGGSQMHRGVQRQQKPGDQLTNRDCVRQVALNLYASPAKLHDRVPRCRIAEVPLPDARGRWLAQKY